MTGYAFIPVRHWDETHYAWVDADLEPLFLQHRWHCVGGYYATCVGLGIMHRYVLGLKKGDGLVAHHINEDSFDNRRQNLAVYPNLIEHGCAPHPRRDARCAGVPHDDLPPFERLVALQEFEQVAA